jgi:hypothetical protein
MAGEVHVALAYAKAALTERGGFSDPPSTRSKTRLLVGCWKSHQRQRCPQ